VSVDEQKGRVKDPFEAHLPLPLRLLRLEPRVVDDDCNSLPGLSRFPHRLPPPRLLLPLLLLLLPLEPSLPLPPLLLLVLLLLLVAGPLERKLLLPLHRPLRLPSSRPALVAAGEKGKLPGRLPVATPLRTPLPLRLEVTGLLVLEGRLWSAMCRSTCR